MIHLILIFIFFAAVVIQLYYAFLLRPRPPAYENQKDLERLPVSVIICARNESFNLQTFLPAVLQQEYPEHLWEVIVVNDGSTDDTGEILAQFQKTFKNLRTVTIAADAVKDLPGKKYALSQGVKAAKYDLLLLTDADCQPASDQWLKIMTGSRSSNRNPQISLGYGAYETHAGLLNKFIRWETVHTCMQYASYARMGMTYMGVGRNLSYPKSLVAELDKNAAFRKIYAGTPSGDDDLLICSIAQKNNVHICLDPKAHTVSVPQKTWNTWWRQKTRHTSTGKYYPEQIKRMLGLYALSHCLYWFSGLFLLTAGLTTDYHSRYALWKINGCLIIPGYVTVSIFLLFLLRLCIYWRNAAKWYSRLNEKKIFLFYPLGDLGWALYNVFLSPYIFWKNRQAWK